MLVRVVTIGCLIAMAGCGDDSVPANGDGHMPDSSMMSDGASPGLCDPVVQDCPTGQRCTLNHNVPINTTFCEMGNGMQGEFMSCDPSQTSDNCLRSTVCLGVNATVRVCRKFCNADGDCGQNVCAIIIGNTNGPLHACAQRCQVLNQSSCTITGEACYLGLNASDQPTQQCSTAGTRTEGQTCTIANDCMPGLMCINSRVGDASGGFLCHKACNFTGTGQCSPSGDCMNNGNCCGLSGQSGLGYCE
jgi:hypothetical protein